MTFGVQMPTLIPNTYIHTYIHKLLIQIKESINQKTKIIKAV